MKYKTEFIKPTLVSLTAPTCSGKSYLLDYMTRTCNPPLFNRVVGTTTRKPRRGEVEGVDYYFLTDRQSRTMEERGEFAELIEFRGIRYGITKAEMDKRMSSHLAPIIILEPNGVDIYQKLCVESGWELFKIFIYTPEATRISRLNTRTYQDIALAEDKLAIKKIIDTHTDRLLSITGDERRWKTLNSWDVLVPGDDVEKAVKDIEKAIKWRNYRNAQLNT